jgi:hypothetical protein
MKQGVFYMKGLRLADQTCLHIAQLLQLAMLTNQDVTHLFRGMLLDEQDGKLTLNEEYLNSYETEIRSLTSKAAKAAQKEAGFVQ